jgi:hypothetical protein
VRYYILLQAQVLLVPRHVRRLLGLTGFPLFYPVVQMYKLFYFLHLDRGVKTLLLPSPYRELVFQLDQ